MILLFLLLFMGAAPAQAQTPACGPAREGQLACMAGRLCVCRFDAGGTLTGRPSAHRWDCGALRPDCPPPPLAPAQPAPPITIAPWMGTAPRGVK